jgi:hypothetical protein
MIINHINKFSDINSSNGINSSSRRIRIRKNIYIIITINNNKNNNNSNRIIDDLCNLCVYVLV